MSAEQKESIEVKFVNRWLYENDLYRRWVDNEIDDDKVIEALPAGTIVENIVSECLARNAILEACQSSSDIEFMIKAENLIFILVYADLITLKQVEEMKKSWDKSINDFMAEEEPCSTD